jgi:hypothetical protein
MGTNKSKYKLVLPSILFLILISCVNDSHKDAGKVETNWKENQMDDLKLLLNKAGMKNVTGSFTEFWLKEDTIYLKNYMSKMVFDSLLLIPGNLPQSYIKEKTNFQLPMLSTPEDNSLIIFKCNGRFVSYAYSSDDTLLLSIKAGNLSYSAGDSTLLIKKKKFENHTVEIIFSNPD